MGTMISETSTFVPSTSSSLPETVTPPPVVEVMNKSAEVMQNAGKGVHLAFEPRFGTPTQPGPTVIPESSLDTIFGMGGEFLGKIESFKFKQALVFIRPFNSSKY